MPFHALGAGGKNLEALVRDGTIRAAVLDLTLQEIAAFIGHGHYSAGEERLNAPADTHTPHLIIPGCVDMIILGKIEQAKKDFPNRYLYGCNDNVSAMRTTKEENRKIARFIAEKVNAAFLKNSPVAILIPGKGFSMFEETLAEWRDPEANLALIQELLHATHPAVPIKVCNTFINDPIFADEAAKIMLQLIKDRKIEWVRPVAKNQQTN